METKRDMDALELFSRMPRNNNAISNALQATLTEYVGKKTAIVVGHLTKLVDEMSQTAAIAKD
eukprot:15455448-Alexandrium_andersonii.AAC.1